MALPYDAYPTVLAIIERIGLGVTMTRACDEYGMPVASFQKHLKNDAELQALYNETEQRGADAMADALLNIDNHRIYGHTDPKMAKVISDNIKWLLARRKPKDYGDKVTVQHDVTLDVVITSALDDAKERVARLAQGGPGVIEDAQVVPQDDEAILREILS